MIMPPAPMLLRGVSWGMHFPSIMQTLTMDFLDSYIVEKKGSLEQC